MLNAPFFNADILDVIECIINETCSNETLKIHTLKKKSFITKSKMLYYYVTFYFKFKIHLFINFCLKCNNIFLKRLIFKILFIILPGDLYNFL